MAVYIPWELQEALVVLGVAVQEQRLVAMEHQAQLTQVVEVEVLVIEQVLLAVLAS